MAIKKSYRLALAKMLKLYTEVSVDGGTLISESEDNELKVGDEVFVEGTDGLEPAPDQEYVDQVNNRIIVVVGGTITEIREKEIENQGNTEENLENNEGSGNGSDNGSDNGEANTNTESEGQDNGEGNQAENNTEDKVKELEGALEAANAKIAELEATVSDLEDQIAAYKAKEEETEPSAEEAEKFSKQTTENKALSKKLAAAKAILNAVK